MTTHKVTLIPGDGTGPELTEATRRVLEAAAATTGSSFDWDVSKKPASTSWRRPARRCPTATLDSIRQTGLAIKGPITTPIGTGFRSVNVALRYELDLYACVRPCKTYAGHAHPVREGRRRHRPREHRGPLRRHRVRARHARRRRRSSTSSTACRTSRSASGSGISIKPMSEFGSERIIRYAFEYAPRQRPQAGALRHQVQHHEVHRRPVPVGVPRGGQGVPGHRAVGEPGRRDLHGPDPAARGVGRAGPAQPLRRHPVRPHRRHGRRPRRRAGRATSAPTPRSSRRPTARRRSTRARTRSTRPR